MRKAIPLLFWGASTTPSEPGRSEIARKQVETVQALLMCHRDPSTSKRCKQVLPVIDYNVSSAPPEKPDPGDSATSNKSIHIFSLLFFAPLPTPYLA